MSTPESIRADVPPLPRKRETPSEQLDRMLADPDEYFRLAWAKAYADARAERERSPLPRSARSRAYRRRQRQIIEVLALGVLGCIIGAGTIALWLMSLTVGR